MRVLSAVFAGAVIVFTAAGTTLPVGNPAELNAAISNAAPGDVIVLHNGTWTDTAIHLNCSGADGKPITLKAETGGEVVLTGASSLDFRGDWLVVEGLKFYQLTAPRVFVDFLDGSDHCRFTECAILDSNNESRNWVHMQRGVSNRVDHCRFSGMNHRGVQFQVETEPDRPNYHRIDRNFFGNRARGRGNGWETMRIGYSHQQTNFSGTTVEWNLFYKCNGENEIISNKSTGNRMLYNTFRENTGELTLRHGNKAWVEGNWFLGNNVGGSGGVRIIGSDHVVINNYFANLRTYAILIRRGVQTKDPKSYTQVKNALVAFNTIVDCPTSFVIGSGRGTLCPENVTIANNLISCAGETLAEFTEPTTNSVYEGNLALCKAVGIPDATGFALVDPKLAKDWEGIFRPVATGPARNAAVGTFAQVTRDISGNFREGKKDVGAQSLTPGAAARAPLTERGVGPKWFMN